MARYPKIAYLRKGNAANTGGQVVQDMHFCKLQLFKLVLKSIH